MSSLSAGVLVPILPPKNAVPPVARSVYLPEEMWDELTAIADETKPEDSGGKGYTRNEVILHFLTWAMGEYRSERKGAKAKR